MASPFPGMNPYLENPELWTEVHSRLIVAIAIDLGPKIRPKYRVAIEKRIYLCDREEPDSVIIPDVSIASPQTPATDPSSIATLRSQMEAIQVKLPIPEEAREGYLEIREVATGYVVTTIEILSPTNKRAGIGREQYEKKRREILGSLTNLVEIDLLRKGKAMPTIGTLPPSDYRILVAPIQGRLYAKLYPFSLRQAIPSFSVSLHRGEIEPVVNLQNLFEQIYEQAGFDLAIDYALEPIPPLKSEDKIWADTLLREKGLRR